MPALEDEVSCTIAALRRCAEHLENLEMFNANQATALAEYQSSTLAIAHRVAASTSSSLAPLLAESQADAQHVSAAFVEQLQRHEAAEEACEARLRALHAARMRALAEGELPLAPEPADLREVEALRVQVHTLEDEQRHLEGLVEYVAAQHTGLRARRLSLEKRIDALRRDTSAATHLSDDVIYRQLRGEP